MDIAPFQSTLSGLFPGTLGSELLAAYGSVPNLAPGVRTTTIESKTNFFARGIEGEKVLGTGSRIHGERSTMVRQARVEPEDRTLIALVSQTQLILDPKS